MRALQIEVLREFAEAARAVPLRPLLGLDRLDGFLLVDKSPGCDRWRAWNELARAGLAPPRGPVDMVAVSLRFWSKVDRSAGPLACWPWTGATTRRRGRVVHGAFGMPAEGRRRSSGRASWTQCAHRVAFALHGPGWPLAPGVEVHRACRTTTLCCNPAHLREGSGKWQPRGGKRSAGDE